MPLYDFTNYVFLSGKLTISRTIPSRISRYNFTNYSHNFNQQSYKAFHGENTERYVYNLTISRIIPFRISRCDLTFFFPSRMIQFLISSHIRRFTEETLTGKVRYLCPITISRVTSQVISRVIPYDITNYSYNCNQQSCKAFHGGNTDW